MNGKRYLLDTNAVISLLSGNQALASRLEEAAWVGISVVSQLEPLIMSKDFGSASLNCAHCARRSCPFSNRPGASAILQGILEFQPPRKEVSNERGTATT
jgi:hypothetical protein